jgi:hypothetical protein
MVIAVQDAGSDPAGAGSVKEKTNPKQALDFVN